jgi:hypothetical protein
MSKAFDIKSVEQFSEPPKSVLEFDKFRVCSHEYVIQALKLGGAGPGTTKAWALHKGVGRYGQHILTVPFNGTACTLHAVLCYLASHLQCLQLQIIEQDFDLEHTLTREVENGLMGIYSALTTVSDQKEYSFARTQGPIDLGYTAILAEAAMSFCRKNKGHGHSIARIPQQFVGSKGNQRWLNSLLAKLKAALSVSENSYIIDSLRSLIGFWADEHQALGRSVLYCQKIPWKEVERQALTFKKVRKKTKKGPKEVLERESYFKAHRSPLLENNEKHRLTLLEKIYFEAREDTMRENWSQSSGPTQHTTFTRNVENLHNLDQERRNYHQKLSAWIGRRLSLMEATTNLSLSKKVKKNRGQYATALARAFLSVNKLQLSRAAKALFHPAVAFNGTTLWELVQRIMSGDYSDIPDSLIHPGIGAWKNAIHQFETTFGKISFDEAVNMPFVDLDNPYEALEEDSGTG